jgi:putative ABC transport system permease protein
MLTLRLARRDLRGAIAGFRLLIAGIALGTFAIATIGLLAAALLGGMRDTTRLAIGGDLSFRLYHHPPTQAHRAAFAQEGDVSLTAELRPLAHHKGRSALVELKAIDSAYPLTGTRPDALAPRNGVWGAAIAPALLEALGAQRGDTITIANRPFQLRALIESEPDRALRAFTLGPRIIVALPSLDGTDLLAPGAQTYWYTRLRLPEGSDSTTTATSLARAFPDAGWRIVDAAQGIPGVERSTAFVASLLGLVAMGILLIGGIGIASAVTAYLDRKRPTIATLRSLGAPASLILRLYLAQILAAALPAIAIGLAAATLAATTATAWLADALPIRHSLAAEPLLLAAAIGLLATLLFALPPLARAAAQSPLAELRAPAPPPPIRIPLKLRAAPFLIAAFLALLLARTAPLPVLAALFAAAAALAALAFLALGHALRAAARRLAHRPRLAPLLRLALSNLHRPGAPTAPLAMAIGLSATLLVTVAVMRANIDRHLAATLPATAPALVLLNLAPADAPRLDAALATLPAVTRWHRAPFLHAPVSRLQGIPVADLRIPAEIAFAIRGDRGVSWQSAPPTAPLAAGTWWPPAYDGPPLASLDATIAARLNLAIGDRLTLVLAGTPTELRIANLRHVDWTGLGLDFPILLSPPNPPPPHRDIAAIWLAPDTTPQTRATLATAFPDAPAVDIAPVIATIAQAAHTAGTALSVAATATGAAALIVLAGAVAATQASRRRDTVVLRMLGATRRQLLAATLLEFAILGTTCAALALAIGTLAAWATIGSYLAFTPAPATALPWAAACLAATAAAALTAATRALAPRRGAD